jgi:deoxyribodipyrimidine photo-lyase
MTAIWWIRRDLRLSDNAALHAALEHDSVIPVFVIDRAFSRSSVRRRNFLYEGLHLLNNDLRGCGSYLILRKGNPADVLEQLLRETEATVIYAEEDYTPYAIRRDREIGLTLPLQLLHGQTIHHPTAVLKADGKPYTVFTPYSKAWKAKLPPVLKLYPAPNNINTPAAIQNEFAATLPGKPLLSGRRTGGARPSGGISTYQDLFLRGRP